MASAIGCRVSRRCRFHPARLSHHRRGERRYRARRGARQRADRNFTGIDSPYEAPEAPALRIDTAQCTAEQAADAVIGKLRALGCIA